MWVSITTSFGSWHVYTLNSDHSPSISQHRTTILIFNDSYEFEPNLINCWFEFWAYLVFYRFMDLNCYFSSSCIFWRSSKISYSLPKLMLISAELSRGINTTTFPLIQVKSLTLLIFSMSITENLWRIHPILSLRWTSYLLRWRCIISPIKNK